MNTRRLNVYVFGAGASCHAGAPLTKDFLERGFDLLCTTPKPDIPRDNFIRIAKLLDALYGSKLLKIIEEAIRKYEVLNLGYEIPEVTIEELLSFVDIAISNQERWMPFDELKEALHDFIFETIVYSTRYSSGSKSPNVDGTVNRPYRNCYQKLVDYLIDVNDQNCFVSFNYDLILDEAVSINNHDLLGDYNLDFVGVENYNDYEKRILGGQRSQKDIDILKLHGSMNWRRCTNCKKFYLAFYSDYKSSQKRSCKYCGNSLSPVLVPPTYKKQIEEYGIVHLWDKASAFLTNADHITIIGYSFPNADIEAKWLFKRSLAQAMKKPRLTLVEPCLDIREKIVGIFDNTVDEISCFETFEDYCEKKQYEKGGQR
jgi:hypothetical protein